MCRTTVRIVLKWPHLEAGGVQLYGDPNRMLSASRFEFLSKPTRALSRAHVPGPTLKLAKWEQGVNPGTP